MFRLRPGVTNRQVEELVATLSKMEISGAPVPIVQRDAGLREGNLDILFICDFADVEDYRRWDSDPEHVRIRREVVAPLVEQVQRIQVRL
jgi:hypothetical protein